jgi:hypothetical protein
MKITVLFYLSMLTSGGKGELSTGVSS